MFKGLTARRLCKSFGVKGLRNVFTHSVCSRTEWYWDLRGSLWLAPLLNQMNLVHNLSFYSHNMLLNIILSSVARSSKHCTVTLRWIIFYLFQLLCLGASVSACSLLLEDDDHMHTDHCHTDDMLLSSVSPLCIPRLASLSLYYTAVHGTRLVFNCLTAVFSLLLSAIF
jgi:hypothetical protein